MFLNFTGSKVRLLNQLTDQDKIVLARRTETEGREIDLQAYGIMIMRRAI